MAAENRPSGAGATSVPPSNTEYSSQGVFSGGTGTGTGSVGQGVTGQTDISGGGTPSDPPNDSTITLVDGNGLSGGGAFTTNQAANSSITFALDSFGMGQGTYGTADNPIQSIQVDSTGRVQTITVQTVAPIPTPFNDQFSSSDDNAPRSASENPMPETVTLMVGPGYTLSDVMPRSTGTVPVTFTEPVLSDMGRTASIDVTVRATTSSTDVVGPATLTTTSTVTETDTGRTRTETATPLDSQVFIPYYFTPMTTSVRGAPADLGAFMASSAALTNGTPVAFTHPGPTGRQFAYLALEQEPGRTYRFDAGFFDISTDPTGMTYTRFGRTFDLYEFPSNGDLSFTIRW